MVIAGTVAVVIPVMVRPLRRDDDRDRSRGRGDASRKAAAVAGAIRRVRPAAVRVVMPGIVARRPRMVTRAPAERGIVKAAGAEKAPAPTASPTPASTPVEAEVGPRTQREAGPERDQRRRSRSRPAGCRPPSGRRSARRPSADWPARSGWRRLSVVTALLRRGDEIAEILRLGPLHLNGSHDGRLLREDGGAELVGPVHVGGHHVEHVGVMRDGPARSCPNSGRRCRPASRRCSDNRRPA